jgi:hypothetical protein
MWWILDVGFSHAIDENIATQAQDKYLHLDCQATNIIYRSSDGIIFGEIINKKNAHEIGFILMRNMGRFRMMMMMMSPRRRCMMMLSMTTTW